MKYIIIATVTALILPAVFFSSVSLADSSRDLTHDEAQEILDLVFQGRPRTALAFADSLAATCEGYPLFHIVRARCYQQFIPMHDADNDFGREKSVPALEELDRCIEVCKRHIEADDPNVDYYYYRGWAWMAKAYVRSMTQNLFTAGREAKRGKKDLNRYLEVHPDDPTARGLLGSFLYFADTVPSAYKFVSKLLLLPTGDREKGLRYLQYAIDNDGLLRNDWRLILYSVYFYFEGRYEEGLAGLQEVCQEYPEYATSAVPLAISRPYVPRFISKNNELVENAINSMYSAPAREVDWGVLYLVQIFRAYGDRYINNPEMTRARLRSIIHESPRHPDWVEGFARIQLGQLYASRGDRDEAIQLFESVADGYSFDHLRDEAKKLLKDVEKNTAYFETPPPPIMDRWIAEVYSSHPDSLTVLRTRFESVSDRSIVATFYVGECDLLAGRHDKALASYDKIIAHKAPRWEHTYQMIASTRIAEIFASRGHYKKAAEYQSQAMDYYHRQYLVDWVIEGRQRYFERLADGKETVEPTLLSINP